MVFNMNRKAQGWIGIGLLVFLLIAVLAFVNLSVGKAFGEINDMIQSEDELGNTSKGVMNDLEQRYSGTMDGVLAMALGLLLILCIGIAWMSTSNPLLMVVAVVLMIMIPLAGALISNSWDEFTSDSEFSSEVVDYPVTNWVLDNYLIVSLIFVVVMVSTMVLKERVI